MHFLSLAGIPAEREAPSLLPGSAARPADIFVPNFAGTQAACLDFAVTHNQQSNLLHCASVCGGAAAERYEGAVKDAKFGEECKAAGLLLVPMVVEVFGRWGERSAEAMKLATKGCANRASERVAFAGAHVRRSLSVTLQRLNARILLARMNPAAEVFADPWAQFEHHSRTENCGPLWTTWRTSVRWPCLPASLRHFLVVLCMWCALCGSSLSASEEVVSVFIKIFNLKNK